MQPRQIADDQEENIGNNYIIPSVKAIKGPCTNHNLKLY